MNIFGKLGFDAIPTDPIVQVTGVMIGLGAIGVLALLTYFKKWTWLWKEWLTTVDHKKIGVMYLIIAFIMLVRGFADAVLMRTHQAMALGEGTGYLPAEHYDQIFTAHGVIMIFFMAMPFLFGLMNFVVPLQIGARDVAYPFLNSLSLWLLVASAMLINASLLIGEFAATGWLAYPPLSELTYSPGVGVDYYIWALQISGIGTLLSAINFFVTIIKMRAPGMKLMQMPIFTWTCLASIILVIAVFPVLTVTLGLLSLDRLLDMHFFTSELGGNAMMYINLIWIWGHPEVYILVLPAFGIYSEVVATFSQKKLFGYASMVWAVMVILILSMIVWLHHFFTMGSGANVNAFFGITTMIISVPTGIKIFNWLFTMFRGKIIFSTPMLWTLGFMVTFTFGGMTGVMMSIPGVDFQVHNSLFLIAHFHNTIIGGVVFGYFAGLIYWFPKIFGFKLHEKLGKASFWCWNIGFYVTFVPLYILGLMGMTRRLNYYTNPEWTPFLIISVCGVALIAAGIGFTVLQLIVSIIQREKLKDTTGDPWNARTLEWSMPSPPPVYNFAIVPHIHERDAFWDMKEKKENLNNQITNKQNIKYEDIHMPKNTALGVFAGGITFFVGFGIIWHIWWLAAALTILCIAFLVYRSFQENTDYYITVKEVEKIEKSYARNI
jgi:cytochrome o ubiquinol oxidase subunit 1